MTPPITYAEKAFLHLAGRRALRNLRAAESAGETYHVLEASGAKLESGARARMFFERCPGGYLPVVRLQGLPEVELEAIASYVLEEPVKVRKRTGDSLEYVREKDAGIMPAS